MCRCYSPRGVGRNAAQTESVFCGADGHSVGRREGDDRTYDSVIAIRAVTTDDFMTCQYAPLPHKVLGRLSERMTNELSSVSRVVYDIMSKPPATVEGSEHDYESEPVRHISSD